jgi:GTP diphosphokinase / guanosine-3',5'-bis(diphosphate) 3'-diphosphatase
MSKGLDQEVYSDFVRALGFPSRKHSRQRRKDADASLYINHPIALVHRFKDRGRDTHY